MTLMGSVKARCVCVCVCVHACVCACVLGCVGVTGFDKAHLDTHNNHTHFSPLLDGCVKQLTAHACIGG